MGKSNKAIAGIVVIVLAVIMFFVGCIDSVELVGKWNTVEMYGEEMDEFWENYNIDYIPAKLYMTFKIGGGYDQGADLTAKGKRELEDEEIKFIENMNESFDGMEDWRWKIDDDEIEMKTEEDGKYEDGEEFSVGFYTLELGKDEEMVLKRANIFCPSIILKALSVVLLLLGAFMLLANSGSVSGATVGGFAQKRCPKCNASASLDDTFCPVCGTPLVEAAPITEPAFDSTVPTGAVCPSCGTPAKPDSKFCQSCGTTLNASAQVTPVVESAPVGLVCPSCGTPAKPDSKFCQSCGTTLNASAQVTPVVESAPVIPATPVREETVYTAPLASSSSAPTSDDGHFEAAGDL